MKSETDTMSHKFPHHRTAQRFGIGLNGPADVAQCIAGFYCGHASAETLPGDAYNSEGFGVRVPDKVGFVRIGVIAV